MIIGINFLIIATWIYNRKFIFFIHYVFSLTELKARICIISKVKKKYNNDACMKKYIRIWWPGFKCNNSSINDLLT